MFVTTVKSGNAIDPYRVVASESFHTEFAARLFGYLTCLALGPYHHWTVTYRP